MRKWKLLLFGGIVWLLSGFPVWAGESGEFYETNVDTWLLEELDLGQIEEELDQVLETDLSFEDTVVQAVEGEGMFSLSALTEKAIAEVKQQWEQQKSTFFSLLSLTLCAAFLANFSNIFKSQQIAEVSFEITYMLLFLVLLGSFHKAVEVTREVLGGMADFMRALIPAYFLSVTLISGSVTAGVFYPFFLGVVHGSGWIMENLLLPFMDAYVILVFVNHLTKEKHLNQLAEGVLKGCGWVLKSMLAVVAGFHVIQGMVSPAVDALKSTAISRAVSAVPGVGNLAGSVTDVILGSGILIKNGIGAAGLVILVTICLLPLVRLGSWVILLELLAALVQPVTDKRMVGCITGISGAGKLLFRMVFTVAVLFMLSIALVTVFTGIRV